MIKRLMLVGACSVWAAIPQSKQIFILSPSLEVVKTLNLSQGPMALCFTPSLDTVWVGTWSGEVYSIDVKSHKVIARKIHRKKVNVILFDEVLNRLWTVADDKTMSVVNLENNMFVQEAVIELEEWASCMALIKGRIWTGLNNGSVCLYNAKTLQLESTLREAHSRTVTVVHYCKVENVGKQNEDKSTVWTGSLDETCFVWKCK